MLLAPLTWKKQRLRDVNDLTNSQVDHFIRKTKSRNWSQNTKLITGLDCPTSPHFLCSPSQEISHEVSSEAAHHIIYGNPIQGLSNIRNAPPKQDFLLHICMSAHELGHFKYAECSRAILSQQIILPAEIFSSSKTLYTFHIFFLSDSVG